MSADHHSSVVRPKYTGTALPTGATTVVIFTTVQAGFGANWFASHGLNRLLMSVNNSQAGTLNAYESSDRGANWVKIDTLAVAAASANTERINDYLVEQYQDWKLEWVNGGVDQTVFAVNLSIVGQRTVAN